MTTMTNPKRAKRAAKSISRYVDDIDEANLIDLLADAMHWCNLNAEDFDRCLRMARDHFDAESTGNA
ncbi:MAG: hypothetical protein K2Y37_02700 [Pirellulales bacterium]|nr:hypothetical protein [Pirellulales bacterium]